MKGKENKHHIEHNVLTLTIEFHPPPTPNTMLTIQTIATILHAIHTVCSLSASSLSIFFLLCKQLCHGLWGLFTTNQSWTNERWFLVTQWHSVLLPITISEQRFNLWHWLTEISTIGALIQFKGNHSNTVKSRKYDKTQLSKKYESFPTKIW